MGRIRLLGFAALCTAIALLVSLGSAFAQERLTYEQYKIDLANYEQRTADAKRALAACKEGNGKLTAFW